MNLEFIKKYFFPNSILDIGAHSGEFYRNSYKIFPNADYYLIEANKDCESNLKELNVPYFIGILSDTEKKINFYKTKLSSGCDCMSTGNSVYREQTSYYNNDNVVITEENTYLLDSIVTKDFDLIKLDVQGSELDIIKGGINTIIKSKGIIMEVSIIEYNKNAPLENIIVSYMDKLGFSPVEVIGSHSNPETHEHIQNDIFFINKNKIF